MRAQFLLVGSLILLLGACSPRVSHAPPPINKQLLTGKWKSNSDTEFISGYEFADDGTLKMTVKGMEQPVRGGYAWSGERTLGMKFKTEADARKGFQAAAKAYKEGVKARMKSGELRGQEGPNLLATIPDELPPEETFLASFSEQPRLLFLVRTPGGTQTFEPAE